jgi:glutamate-1-semialdehyde 2,1-aminomutase
MQPFPPRISSSNGAWVVDEDGNRILDFWQGHFANILGHNPAPVVDTLTRCFLEGEGLQSGFVERLQVEVAEILCQQSGYERIRFTTSGALATTYAIMLARAHTGRDLVLKTGGGWHGATAWGLKGLSWKEGFGEVEGAGIPAAVTEETVITGFNNCDLLEDHFRLFGDQLACFILEPVIGAGGLMPASSDYLTAARELTEQYGVVLVFDEVITGFRYRAGDVGELYGLKGDLAAFGKIIGGGMPVAAVAGRADIMNLVGRRSQRQVKFSGGTYAGHPASMLATRTMLRYLTDKEDEIYPAISKTSNLVRQVVSKAFSDEGIYTRFAGDQIDAPIQNSMHMLLFPNRQDLKLDTPEEVRNPSFCDLFLSEEVLKLALLLEDVYTEHGLGIITAAHTTDDIHFLGRACGRVARQLKPYR